MQYSLTTITLDLEYLRIVRHIIILRILQSGNVKSYRNFQIAV